MSASITKGLASRLRQLSDQLDRFDAALAARDPYGIATETLELDTVLEELAGSISTARKSLRDLMSGTSPFSRAS